MAESAWGLLRAKNRASPIGVSIDITPAFYTHFAASANSSLRGQAGIAKS
jgi:hypothetical protein